MAFTKSPTTDTHNTVRITPGGSPFVVSSFSLQPNTLKYRNCFPLTEEQWNNEPKRTVHKRSGYTTSVSTGTVTNTGYRSGSIVQATSTYNAFVAKYNTLYSFNYGTNTVTAVVGAANDVGSGHGTNLIDNSNARRIAWLGGGSSRALYTCLEDGTGFTTTSLIANDVVGYKGLVFIDGYLFGVDASGTKIFNSTAGGVYGTWATTDFIDAEQYADRVEFIAKHKNYLVAFGQTSIEFFYNNAVEVGSPMARQESYATRVGITMPDPTDTNLYSLPAVNIEDDLYFIGISESNSRSLYRIKNFQVEEIQSQYVQNVLNDINNTYYGLAVYVINQNPMIVVELEYGGANGYIAYFPREDVWWQVHGTDFPSATERLGAPFVPTFGYYGISNGVLTNPVAANTTVKLYQPDVANAVSVEAQLFTDVIDLGTNRYKHLARIDAIGDYNANSLSMEINLTPNYQQTFTSVGSAQVASTIGYGNNISWYNIGAPRQFILKFYMSGTYPAIHKGFDLEYNVGVA